MKIDNGKRGFFGVTGSIILLILILPAIAFPEEIKIGVLAYRGKDEALKRWSPTADYLTMSIPGHRFSVVPLDFEEIGPATRDRKIDFLITNTSIYVELESAFGISRIATLKNRWKDKIHTTFGGVIFTRSERGDINKLKDLRGKTFMAVDETSLGGWRMAWREMKDRGINPHKDLKIRFGKTHDRVVMAVLNREVDAGTVRTDILERMATAGVINLKDLKILNEQRVEGFPFLLSTRLYPEWPFASLKHVSNELAEKVAIALISMPPEGIAAIASGSAGWTVPLDYYPVHELMKELRVGPYRDYGRITLSSFIRQYWYIILLTLTIIITLSVLLTIIWRLNKGLTASRLRLQHAMDGLEILVKDRTKELEDKNRELTIEIEKRREIEGEILRAKNEWEQIFDSIPDLIALIGPDKKILKANKSLIDLAKAKGFDIYKGFCHELMCGMDEKDRGHYCPCERMFSSGISQEDELYIDHLKNYFLVSATPLRDNKDNIVACIHVAKNITAIKMVEERLRETTKFLHSILDAMPDQIIVIGTDYRIRLSNIPLTDTSVTCYKLTHDRDTPCEGQEHPCPLKEVINNKKDFGVVHEHLQPDGSKRIVEILASPIFNEQGEIIYVIEATRDITERVRLEEENRRLLENLYLNEKEKSILTLTGGIAHDFNNMLMSVFGSAELLRMSARNEDLRYIDNIINSAERMSTLVKQMLAYSGQGFYQPSRIDVNESIRRALNLTHKGKDLKIKVDLDLEAGLWQVFADRSQLDQMMVYLIQNAFEAMAEKGDSLSIKTSNIEVKTPLKCSPFDHYLPEGEYVQIKVKDTGQGIPKDLHRRVFEPFFTTRFMGRGLGLSAVEGIVKSHQGCISLESEEGKGATFTIYLPRASETGIKTEGRTLKDSRVKGILIADDEETILNLLKETLSGAGYEVYTAMDGLTALDRFKEARDKIELAIIDIEMPGLNGREVISELRGLSKDIKIIVSSGYDEKTALDGIDPKPDAFIQKPYRLSVLLRKVKEFEDEGMDHP